MIKYLRNYSVLQDGTAFKRLQLVPESTMLIGRRILLHNWKGLLKINWLFTMRKLPAGETYVLAHHSYHGYYHWMLESLPKLLEAQRTLPNFTLLLPDFYTDSFYHDTLKLLGISAIMSLEAGTLYKVPALALAYSDITMGSYDGNTLLNLKASLLDPLLPIATERPRKLYVSRKRATRRKVLNEEAVELALTAHGFEIICFEDYTFEQQIRICITAEVLIGIHGAGLTNMLFQQTGARLIELRKFDNGVNIFFSDLANTLGLRYQLLYCQSHDEQALVQDADLWVDVDALLALLV